MTHLQSQPSQQPDLSGLLTAKQQHTQPVEEQVWIDVIQQMDSIYTELVQNQQELEAKNTALEDAQLYIQSVISSMSDILIVCDNHNTISQVNSALESITGINAESLIGQALVNLFTPEQENLIQDFPAQLRSGALIDIEVNLRHKTQDITPMAINCSPLHDHKNRLAGYVITGRPLGELRKAYSELHQAHEQLKSTQQRLIQSEKMASLGRLVAGVAHELNNPISFLYANMHALQNYEKRLQTYLTAIHSTPRVAGCQQLRTELNIDKILNDLQPLITGSLEGAERVSEIVRNLRQFATPQTQQKSYFDIVVLIQRACAWVLNAAELKPDIKTDYPKQLTLFNNKGYIHQILINLIQNAVDSIAELSPHTPQLYISIQTTKSKINIRIHDNGHGIKQQDIIRIFDPFFTTKPAGYGTGLGLYISYGLAVEQCHGDLTAANRPQGGAVFTLSLPNEAPHD